MVFIFLNDDILNGYMRTYLIPRTAEQRAKAQITTCGSNPGSALETSDRSKLLLSEH